MSQGDFEVGAVEHQTADADEAGDGGLAGEAYVGLQALGTGHGLLGRVSREPVLGPFVDHDASGGAAGVAAAGVDVRRAVLVSDLKQRLAGFGADRLRVLEVLLVHGA